MRKHISIEKIMIGIMATGVIFSTFIFLKAPNPLLGALDTLSSFELVVMIILHDLAKCQK